MWGRGGRQEIKFSVEAVLHCFMRTAAIWYITTLQSPSKCVCQADFTPMPALEQLTAAAKPLYFFFMGSDNRISWGEPPGQAAEFRSKIIDKHVYACDIRNYSRRHKTSIEHCYSNHSVEKKSWFPAEPEQAQVQNCFPCHITEIYWWQSGLLKMLTSE